MNAEPNAAATSERAAIVRWLRSRADAADGAESLTLHRVIVGIVDGEHLAEDDFDDDDTQIFTDIESELDAAFRIVDTPN